jgi:Starch-binding associating with outer membrane
MHNLKIVSVILLLSFAISSCKKSFFDINQNPNQVTADKITSELILPSALHLSGAATANFRFLNRWMGYWSYNPTFNLDPEEVTYNVTTTFPEFAAMWNGYYDALFDLHNIEEKATGENVPFYAGIAKVMRARLFQDLVDAFGNVPYSEAFKTKEFATPKYDKGQDIYKDLMVVLDSAINIFKNKPVPSKASTVDIMYQGNAELWLKFANTIRLRCLIRQSQVSGFNPTTELAKITANGGVLMSGESADVNPGYENAVGKQNPFYANFGFTVTGTEPNRGANVRANNYLLDILKNSNDLRISRIYRPAAIPVNPLNPFVGTTYGAPPDASLSGSNVSYVGTGLSANSSQSQWLTTSVESMFLFAEAVIRGWLPGNEQTAYENAVRESFIWLGVPNAVSAANSYMANNSIANWSNAGATVDTKVKFVTFQKYIAMAGMNPLEAWNDYKRLGVPAPPPLSVHPGRVGNDLPIRLLYPSAEYAVNSANVLAQGSINQFTSKVFWDL